MKSHRFFRIKSNIKLKHRWVDRFTLLMTEQMSWSLLCLSQISHHICWPAHFRYLNLCKCLHASYSSFFSKVFTVNTVISQINTGTTENSWWTEISLSSPPSMTTPISVASLKLVRPFSVDYHDSVVLYLVC